MSLNKIGQLSESSSKQMSTLDIEFEKMSVHC